MENKELCVANKDYTEEAKRKFFPDIDPGIKPVGNQILIMGMFIPPKSTGGIILSDDFKLSESYDIALGKIVAFGPLAFRNKQTLENWNEGNWAEIGDIIYLPRTGYRLSKKVAENTYSFVLINDADVKAVIRDLQGLSLFNL